MDHQSQGPRKLGYRFYYKWYAFTLACVWLMCLFAVAFIFVEHRENITGNHRDELFSFVALSLFLPSLYLWWLHPKLSQTIQVFPKFIRVNQKNKYFDICYNQIDSISNPFLSFVRINLRDKNTFWMSAAIERPDYIWEGIVKACPELVGKNDEHEAVRLKLVQYDHHEKRKEWFFRHRMLDFVNWVAMPAIVLIASYRFQTEEIMIYSKSLYFFRLTMYSLFIAIVSAFSWSVITKFFVFDKLVADNMQEGSKLRDLKREDTVLQRSKLLQLFTCSVLMFMMVKFDLNLFSITKIKKNYQSFNLTSGKTAIVDNRFNCFECKHSLQDGDIVLFAKGSLAQVMARPGEVIAQVQEGSLGRSIASETIITIPSDHVALKTGDSNEIIVVKISDLIGKVKNK